MNSPATPQKLTLNLKIYSDSICPWCYIGKRRLEKARLALGEGYEVRTTWLPFELNPTMPREGMERRAYRSAKFGSWAKSQSMDAHVAEVGATEGIEFHHERMARTPNTFDSHRLVMLAGREGRQDAVIEGIFKAYFVEGRDIGQPETLVEIAVAAGLDADAVRSMLGGDQLASEVRAEEAEAQRLGLRGVPLYILNDREAVSGADDADALAKAFRQAARTAE